MDVLDPSPLSTPGSVFQAGAFAVIVQSRSYRSFHPFEPYQKAMRRPVCK